MLLNEFGRIAKQEGWIHAHLEATEDVRIGQWTAALTRRVLWSSVSGHARKIVRRRPLECSEASSRFTSQWAETLDRWLSILSHEPGQADSGELDGDLSGVFTEVGETARDAETGVFLTIDEIQYLGRSELSALIIGLHRVSQLGFPLLVAGAGLPSLPGLAGEARSYAERLFRYVEIGSLTRSDARKALTLPAEQEGGAWSSNAVDRVISQTQGYPYFLQEFGKQAWNLARGDAITVDDVKAATRLAIEDLDQGFFRARIDKTTDAERDYLRAMAALGGPGPYKSGRRVRQTREEDHTDRAHPGQSDQAGTLLRTAPRRTCVHGPDVR